MSNLYDLGALEAHRGINQGDFTAEEYVWSIIERIERVEGKVHAFITLNKENALDDAREIDKKIRTKEDAGSLAGVTVGIKDNISTHGLKTTCASKMLENYVPPYDATVVERLKNHGAIVIGKLNLDEFGMGSTTEYSRYGPTHNPWNLDYVPGGSSGGSGAAVSSRECTVSLGSDTGGSVRCPASFCSVVGLKPTYGSVSRFGLISYANSLEQIGPICRTVEDVVTVMNAISGHDPNDNTCFLSRSNVPYLHIKQDRAPSSIAIVKELIDGCDPAVSRTIYSALDNFKEFGWECTEISLKSVNYALPSYYTIAMAEASSNLARYDNIRYGFSFPVEGFEWNTYISDVRSNFGEEVKRRILIGSYVLSSGYYSKYYLKARQLRSLLRQEVLSNFAKYDLLVGPTMPVLPFRLGEKIDDPLKMYLMDVDTVLANLAGIPA
ncbi:MAG: Asp-tRNA(Asn)/Glu-tRNA(Gln) amidotransferase subunit GatA, partial [Thermoproteota archaeon]|nr:Asp-tRNA(Asn)/Glu-tRNA(Gln) amidotransferase subunit GatA [Thermoproteota archaeon]